MKISIDTIVGCKPYSKVGVLIVRIQWNIDVLTHIYHILVYGMRSNPSYLEGKETYEKEEIY